LIQLFRVIGLAKTYDSSMVMLRWFYLSHTMEPLYLPEQTLVDEFLPKYTAPYKLDIDNPVEFWSSRAKGDSFYMLKKNVGQDT